ncbi:MAG: hypothetical protein KZQ83_04165 [gamma proteobacterium symbiont of Taylorina sp.]|nr:hypothetical protein [gamma proteobacterium symbiont of Taylorina sp.]
MPIIYAISRKGKDKAVFHLEAGPGGEIQANDWEDMDAFKYHGTPYLLIADTGDNFRLRFDYQIYIIKEPELNNRNHSRISPAWSFNFEFEDGQSYDVESVAVDMAAERIILLTKRTPHALMFELPLKPDNLDQTQIAIKSGEFKSIVNPTALDISADGQLMSINTYARIHRFHRSNDSRNQWIYDYSLSYKKLFQPEGMCLSKNNKNYYVSSERKAKLLKIKINQ